MVSWFTVRPQMEYNNDIMGIITFLLNCLCVQYFNDYYLLYNDDVHLAHIISKQIRFAVCVSLLFFTLTPTPCHQLITVRSASSPFNLNAIDWIAEQILLFSTSSQYRTYTYINIYNMHRNVYHFVDLFIYLPFTYTAIQAQ